MDKISKKIRKKTDWSAYLFIGPALIIFLLFLAYPIVSGLLLAFQKYRLDDHRIWVGLKNFKYILFYDPAFWVALKNTLIYSVVRIPAVILLSLVVASLLASISHRVQIWLRGAYYLPTIVSLVVISMVWKWLYNPNYGFINEIIKLFGGKPIPWLTSTEYAFPSIVIMSILTSPGSSIIIYLAAIFGIDQTVYEAADIDGANPLQKWLYITIPLLKNVTLYLIVMNTIASFQVFTQVYIMTKGGPGYSTLTIVPAIYYRAFRDFDFGTSSAQALILFIIIGLISLLQFKLMKSKGW